MVQFFFLVEYLQKGFIFGIVQGFRVLVYLCLNVGVYVRVR